MVAKLARGILPALCTPFDDSGGSLAPERISLLIRGLLDRGVNGFFACGGTGEGGAMTVAERKQMAELTLKEVAGAVPVIVQVGATATENAVELAKHAAATGAPAVGSVAPIDNPNNLAAAAKHYSAIGAAVDIPFYVYWLAREAQNDVSADEFLEAMRSVPNFSGIKFTDTNLYFFQRLIDLTNGEINAISGPDEICLAAMVMGSDAAIGSTYNVMPKIFVNMRQAFEIGDMRQAMDLQLHANRVITVLIAHGVMASIKAVLGWRGTPVGPPRAPHKPLDGQGADSLRAALEDLDFEVS